MPVHPLTLARYRAAFIPSGATDDPPDAALQVAFLLTHRGQLTPLSPRSPTMRVLTQLVAHRDDQQQRDQGKAHQATVRAVACTGIRMLSRCWHERTPYDASTSLQALTRRGSSLIHNLAKAS